MGDDEKRENLANARRKLKKFRDQQPNIPEANDNNTQSANRPFESDPNVNYNLTSQIGPSFVNEQQSILNGTHHKSPITDSRVNLPEQSHLEDQRRFNSGSSMSGRTSQSSIDIEQKLRRDLEHSQEQLEIHVQTIGILVAEKTDVSAKLTQSFKQLERKQSEMDELHGRLKASRERVQELEKEMQNSTSNVQKREMAAKESDKENDRLKIENIRQSQLIEDLKQNINQLNEKLQQQLEKSTSETSIIDQQTISLKNNQIEELVSSVNRIRSANEQYQQYNTNMQHHIQEQNDQIDQLNQTNHFLQTEYDTMKNTYEVKLTEHGLSFDYENLREENDLFRNAIDQWSSRYEDLKVKLEEMTKLSIDNNELIVQLQTNETNSKESIQRLEQETQTEEHSIVVPQDENEQSQQQLTELIDENTALKDHAQHLEHTILQLQSETDTIGDYIYLYQQQREQLQRRYQEKDDYIQQLTQDRLHLQKKLSELEILLIRTLNTSESIPFDASEPTDTPSSTIDQTITSSTSETMNSTLLPQLSAESRAHILALIKELGQNRSSSIENDHSSTVKLAFVDKNLYICSTCSGPVQWV